MLLLARVQHGFSAVPGTWPTEQKVPPSTEGTFSRKQIPYRYSSRGVCSWSLPLVLSSVVGDAPDRSFQPVCLSSIAFAPKPLTYAMIIQQSVEVHTPDAGYPKLSPEPSRESSTNEKRVHAVVVCASSTKDVG